MRFRRAVRRRGSGGGVVSLSLSLSLTHADKDSHIHSVYIKSTAADDLVAATPHSQTACLGFISRGLGLLPPPADTFIIAIILYCTTPALRPHYSTVGSNGPVW